MAKRKKKKRKWPEDDTGASYLPTPEEIETQAILIRCRNEVAYRKSRQHHCRVGENYETGVNRVSFGNGGHGIGGFPFWGRERA